MPTITDQAPVSFGIDADLRSPYQRRERRHPIPRGLKLQLRTSSHQELVEVELRDLSRNGVGLISPRLIPPGASVNFQFGSQRIFAQARYCRSISTGFVVGALILEVVAENGAIAPALNV